MIAASNKLGSKKNIANNNMCEYVIVPAQQQ